MKRQGWIERDRNVDKNGQGKKTGQRDGLENRQGDGQNLDK